MKKISKKIKTLLNWFFIDLKLIKRNTNLYKSERKKIKDLAYYYITDNNKKVYLEKKENLSKLLYKDASCGTKIFIPLRQAIKKTGIFLLPILLFGVIVRLLILGTYPSNQNLLTYILAILVFGLPFLIVEILFENDITWFLFIILSFNYIFLSISNEIPDIKLTYKIIIYFIATLLMHLTLTWTLTLHTLRKLNNIIDPMLFLINSFIFFTIIKFDLYHTSTTEIIIVNNIVTTFIISYTTWKLIINHKIKSKKNNAKTLFRTMIKDSSKINYHSLVKCAYYGGEEYENLMLNNEQMKNIIIEAESNLEIPEENSWKDKIIKYFKSFFSTIYRRVTNLFNKFKL